MNVPPKKWLPVLVGLALTLAVGACAGLLDSTEEYWCSRPTCPTPEEQSPVVNTPLPAESTQAPSATPSPEPSPTPAPSDTPLPTPTLPTPPPPVPDFDHIVVIVLENKDYQWIIGNPDLPNFNRLAVENTLLTNYYAVAHPSLPNYLAMVGGDTFGIARNCEDCFVNAPNLAGLVEQSGRTWKTYQESMPEPCFIGSRGDYVQKHNPFVYFDDIRLDTARCRERVVPLDQLSRDISASELPHFAFITPGLCHSGHDCSMVEMDAWLGQMMDTLRFSGALGDEYLIVVTFDEASGDDSSGCCGVAEPAGGRIATLLVSPQARFPFEDSIPYSHYSLLKTIAEAWSLPLIGNAAQAETEAILAPWRQPTAGETVLLAAGDITICGTSRDDVTARLLDFAPGQIVTLGDNSNEVGNLEAYEKCFDRTWGRHLPRLRTSAGNHDYETDSGEAYHAYFGEAAGEFGKGYYSFDLGSWHIVALNSHCEAVGGCGADSPQLAWLRDDLAAHPAPCTLAYWHIPRFSAGTRGNSDLPIEFWRELYTAGADVILNGHDHLYQRFAPQDPSGAADELGGIRQFTVGTGGAFYGSLASEPSATSQRLILDTFGVLQLRLGEGTYDWRFLPEPGKPFTDSGSDVCH